MRATLIIETSGKAVTISRALNRAELEMLIALVRVEASGPLLQWCDEIEQCIGGSTPISAPTSTNPSAVSGPVAPDSDDFVDAHEAPNDLGDAGPIDE